MVWVWRGIREDQNQAGSCSEGSRRRYVLQKRVRDDLAGGEGGVDGNLELERLGIDITDVDTTFVREENVVALSLGVDADVVLGIRRVRQERLDDEVVQRAGHRLNLIRVISH